MDLLVWLVVGAVTGTAAHALSPRRYVLGGVGPVSGDLLMGVAGAALGGWLCEELGWSPLGGLAGSVALALFGAIMSLSLLRLLHAMKR